MNVAVEMIGVTGENNDKPRLVPNFERFFFDVATIGLKCGRSFLAGSHDVFVLELRERFA